MLVRVRVRVIFGYDVIISMYSAMVEINSEPGVDLARIILLSSSTVRSNLTRD